MKKFYFILTLLCLFSFSFLISFNVFAQDGAPDGSHGSVSYNQKDKTMNFFMSAGESAGQLFYGLGEDVVNGVDNAYAVWLYQFKPESELSMGEKQLINHFCDIDEGNEDASVIFDIDDSFNFTLKDEYQEDCDSIMDSVVTSINNQYLLYPTKSGDFINKIGYPDFNIQDAKDSLSSYNGDDFPLYCYRSSNRFYSCSLENLNGDSSIDCDGFIFNYGDWAYLCNHWDIFVNYGYLPNVNDQGVNCAFYVYSNSVRFDQRSSFKYNWGSDIFPQPFYVYAYRYYDYWYPNNAQDVTFILGKSDIPMLFFRDFTSYNNFYNSKQSIPYDFSGLDFPENFDYSEFFRNIDNDLVDNTHNLEELYSYLSTELKDSIDRINDSLKDTNSILKEIRDLIGDKWDRSLGKNVLDYLPDIVDKLEDIYWDVHALNPDNVQQLTETILQDSSLENRLKHIFPFGVFQDFKDLSEVLAGVEQKELVFTFTTQHFYWGSDSGETTIEINISELPAFNVVKSMINFFVICLFNYSMARIEFKFISVFFGG